MVSTTATSTKVGGSVAFTSNSNPFINRVRPKAAATPSVMPSKTSVIPCRMTSFKTSPSCAPNAIRTPISCVRCATRYESTL